MREAQLLFLVFISLTFSSGLPILYPIAFVSLFITYWAATFLLLRFYRLPPVSTKHLSNSVVLKLPYAILLHFLFGFFMFSFPNMLYSFEVTPWMGIENPNNLLFGYLNLKRLQ